MMKIPFLILSFFILVQGLLAQDKAVIDEVIAVVGSEILLKSDYEKQLVQYKTQGNSNDENLPCIMLEDLLYSKLLLNQAKLDSIEVSPKQIDAELDRRINYFISQIGSERALEEYYKKSMAEIKSELRANLEDQMVIQQMQGTVTDGMDVTPSEVRKFYRELPEDSLPFVNEQIELAQIVIIAPPSRQSIEEAREKLNKLRERISEGEDFSTMAVLYSEDPGTATQGGELGFVGKAEVDPAFAEAAFKLKGNEVSRIVTSEFGLHIIQLIERDGDKVNVRHILIKPKVEGSEILKAKSTCDSIKRVIESSDSISFALAAVRHSDDVDSKNNGGLMVNPYSGSSLFQYDQLDPSVYVAIENLEKYDVSESSSYSTRDGKRGYSLFFVMDKIEQHRASLELDYQQIQEAALSRKQQSVVEDWIGNKLKTTYIKLSEDFKWCEFENDWYKVN